MARRSSPAKPAARTTPIAEWLAAAVGLLLTLAVLGHTLWEGLQDEGEPPALSVRAEPARPIAGGRLVPIVVLNASQATAAQVTVRARVTGETGLLEERTVTFAYVPGGGQARGAVMLQTLTDQGRLDLSVDGFADP